MKPLYLNGEWVKTGKTIRVLNPATTEAVGEVCVTDRAGAAKAINDGQAAFKQWRRRTGRERGEVLHAFGNALHARRDEVARLITLENGKPLSQSRGEVAMSVDHFHWFAEEARREYGRVVPHQAEGKRNLVIKSPMGVVAAIAPWNFPLALSVRKVAPAMASGCTVILKPASATPLCAVALAECAEAAKVPAGVFQLIAGPAKELAQEFLDNPLCRKITFTGSTEVGKELIRGAAAHVKPLSLELGGHAPVLVFADANLEVAVKGTMMTKFRNTGQSCIASNRIYVERSIYAKFLEAFVAQTKALKIGDGLEPGVEIGPLINEAGLQKALEHIQDATKRGARLLCGGNKVKRPGWFLEPTVLADVPADAACLCEETFAPVAPVCRFDTEEQALEMANNSPYGLSAYAFTTDIDRAFRVMEALEAGTIGLNDGLPTTSQCPFGGMKQAGGTGSWAWKGWKHFSKPNTCRSELKHEQSRRDFHWPAPARVRHGVGQGDGGARARLVEENELHDF
jgi:succinate-semialdehyde dehydrogenase/glutarate-semialdehyde dehydrogenase